MTFEISNNAFNCGVWMVVRIKMRRPCSWEIDRQMEKDVLWQPPSKGTEAGQAT